MLALHQIFNDTVSHKLYMTLICSNSIVFISTIAKHVHTYNILNLLSFEEVFLLCIWKWNPFTKCM